MAEQTVGKYKSRRNDVRLVQTDEGRCVVKVFPEGEAFHRELQMYRLLQDGGLPCAAVLAAQENTLVLTQLPGRNLVDCLEEQEQTGRPVWNVWEKLVEWLIAFHRHTGLVMTDVNLRNFLYDEKTNMLYGVDFEECDVGSMAVCAARVAAFIRTYTPAHTALKQELSQYILNRFAQECGLECDTLVREAGRQEEKLLERRNNQK